MVVMLHHYRPHLDKAEDLEAISVAREPLLEEILSTLQRWEPGASRQHYLLVGPRGIGKTHLLRLLQHRILKTATLSRKWWPLLFPEEQYTIMSVPDLLIETLRLLSETSRDATLQECYLRLKKESADNKVVDSALDALRGFCKARRCGVLLMLENVNRLLQNQIKKDSEIGLLRRILTEEDWPILLATSPTQLSEVTDSNRSLFEFFQVEYLEELSPEAVETLLRKRAELDKDGDFLTYLDRYRPRLRALYHFSGGNPRLTLMLYNLLAHQALTDIRIELDGLLNQLTPFYQDRMKEVGPQEAKVLTTMALLTEGVTPTELAEECRMDRTLVSALLSRLEKAGYVRREPRSNKQTVYAIPERFFRIWHQMSSSRAARGRVQYLLDFFLTWYTTAQERDEIWDRLVTQFQRGAAQGEDTRREDISTYMDYIATISQGTERLERHFDRLRQYAQSGEVGRVTEGLRSLDQEFSGDAAYFVRKGEFLAIELGSDSTALEAFRQALQLNRGQLEALFNEAVALDRLGQHQTAWETYAQAIELLSTQHGRQAVKNTTQFLLHLLRDESEERLIRIVAYLLGRTADRTVCSQLIDILTHADTPWRRGHVVTALGLLGAPDAIPALLECLGDRAARVRACAATALGNIGASEAVPTLIQALRDEVETVRASAATALGKIHAFKAVPALTECLKDEADAVRASAATALGRIGVREAASALVESLADEASSVRGSAAIALGRIGTPEVVSPLIESLGDKATNARTSAATALGNVGAVDAVPSLIKCLREDGDPISRGAAATALGKIGAMEAIPLLLTSLQAEESALRGSAATALCNMGATEAEPLLIRCLRADNDPANRGAAATALGKISATERAVESLIASLHDEARNVRGSAATALGNTGAIEAVPALIECLRKADDPRSQDAAAAALGKIGGEEAVRSLIRCLCEHSDPTTRGVAATVLGKIGAEEAVPFLIESLRDEAVPVRAGAAAALGRIGALEAVPSLITSLTDAADSVRAKVSAALGRIGAVEAVPSLIRSLHDEALAVRTNAAVALGRINASEGVPALIECLRDEASEMRCMAAIALGKIGAAEAAPVLVECLHDGDSAVRSSAATALGRIGTGDALAAVVDAIPEIIDVLRTQPDATRVGIAGFFLRAAFRSGNLSIAEAFVNAFVSQFEDGADIFLPQRIALEFLQSDRNPMILHRQLPEMREAVELLVWLFDKSEKGG